LKYFLSAGVDLGRSFGDAYKESLYSSKGSEIEVGEGGLHSINIRIEIEKEIV